MKRDEASLERLLAAARAVGDEPEVALPGYLRTRLLAQWRSGSGPDEAMQGLILLFRRALICAGIFMIVCVALSYHELTRPPESDVAIANYELRADVMP